MGISFAIDKDQGKNLAYVTVHEGHKMTLLEFAKQCEEKFKKVRESNDTAEIDPLANKLCGEYTLPPFLVRFIAFPVTYLSLACGFSIPSFGIDADTYGGVLINNVGTFGW